MAGVGFSDVETGVEYVSDPYELAAEEIREMSARWDPLDFHLDDDAAAQSTFGGLVASAIHTLAIANLLAQTTGPRWDIQALLSSEYRLPAPARAGDALTLTMVAPAKRPSRSRPGSGIVTNSQTLRNQHGDVVAEVTAQVLVGPGTA